jgi:hypothetical protein
MWLDGGTQGLFKVVRLKYQPPVKTTDSRAYRVTDVHSDYLNSHNDCAPGAMCFCQCILSLPELSDLSDWSDWSDMKV